jgi:Rap1a immunity proteins
VGVREPTRDVDGLVREGGRPVDLAEDRQRLRRVGPAHHRRVLAVEGMKHYHDRMSAGPGVEPIVCAPAGVKLEDAIEMYVTYARANPQFLDEDPADNVIRAAMATWPCS